MYNRRAISVLFPLVEQKATVVNRDIESEGRLKFNGERDEKTEKRKKKKRIKKEQNKIIVIIQKKGHNRKRCERWKRSGLRVAQRSSAACV